MNGNAARHSLNFPPYISAVKQQQLISFAQSTAAANSPGKLSFLFGPLVHPAWSAHSLSQSVSVLPSYYEHHTTGDTMGEGEPAPAGTSGYQDIY